jgi:acyl-CoA reductase-like NAD-dependent aldehyde dehydrogenase
LNTSCHAPGDEAEGRSRTSSLTLRAAALNKGIDEGADVLVGGEGHPKGLEAGYFVKPTVFVNVKNDMTIAREEIFGPVLCVIPYENDEDAVRIANDTNFGLHAYISGTDLKRARRVASQLLAGRSKRLDRAFEAEAKHERTCR